MNYLPVTDQIRNDYDNATLEWLAINDPRRRRAMWFQRVVLNDRELTVTALRLAGLVLGSYEIGAGNPVKLSLRRTAEKLGVGKRNLMHARDLLVEHGWLVRVNDGSSRTAAYDLGPGPRVSHATPSRVSPKTPQSNKSLTSLSESKRSLSQKTDSVREDKSRASLKIEDWLVDDAVDEIPF
jgi:hypothetical protein